LTVIIEFHWNTAFLPFLLISALMNNNEKT